MCHFGFEKAILLGHSTGSVSWVWCVRVLSQSLHPASTFIRLIDGYIALDSLRPIPREPVKTMRKIVQTMFGVEDKLSLRRPTPAYTYDAPIGRSCLGREKSISREGCKVLPDRGSFQRPDGKYTYKVMTSASQSQLPLAGSLRSFRHQV